MLRICAILIASSMTATMGYGQAYTTGFEYADTNAMQADGWVFSQATATLIWTIS